MWKKIGLVLLGVVIVLFGAIYWQINRAQTAVAQLLNEKDVRFEQLDLDFFPSPRATLTKIKYVNNHPFIFADEAAVSFSLLEALTGKFRVDEIRLQNGTIRNPDYQAVNLTLKPTALYVGDAPEVLRALVTKNVPDELSNKWGFYLSSLSLQNTAGDSVELVGDGRITADGFGGNLKLSVQLAKPAYNQNSTFGLELNKFYFKQVKPTNYRLVAESVTINNTGLGSVQAEINMLTPQDKGYQVTLQTSACRDCASYLTWQPTDKQQRLQFRTDNFPLQLLLKILKLPVFAEGESDVNADLLFDNLIPQQGKFSLNITDGKLHGLNILQLVAQYLPINYDQDNPLDTRFEQFSAVYDWNKTRLLVEKLSLRSKELQISGTGKVETDKMQCDIRLNVGVTNPKYKDLSVPLRFFDSCYSPQYSIDVNKGLRDQLKNYLKDRFN